MKYEPEIENLLGGRDEASLAGFVSSAVLSDYLGVTPRTVTELANRKILVRDGRHYPLRDSIRAYTAHLREQAAARSNGKNLTAERTRLASEQADQAALKNAALRKDLIPAAEVEKTWASILRDVRGAMLAIPNRIRQITAFEAADIDLIDRAIRDALTEVAHGNP